jgi:outer membrane lipopolysaccharide assembly protein LptE/RlpB
VVRLNLNHILKIKHTPLQLLHVSKAIVLLLTACVFSCQNTSKVEKEISAIDIDLNIERFDQMFA